MLSFPLWPMKLPSGCFTTCLSWICASSCDSERPYTLPFFVPELYIRLSDTYWSAPSLNRGRSLYLPEESGPPLANSNLLFRPTSMYRALSSMLSVFTVACLNKLALPDFISNTMESFASYRMGD